MANHFLYTVPYKELLLWDVKRYKKLEFSSNYPIVYLGNHINSETEKIELCNYPEQDFDILGITNDKGMIDAYTAKGKAFNQAYKIIKDGFIAYNPYRVNVGSIGIKNNTIKGNLISPAYVVFSCQSTILPEFLFVLMKTQQFHNQIKENTSGSVRQNLTFDALSRIRIPLPNIEEQKELIDEYSETIALSQECERKASYISDKDERHMLMTLDIHKKTIFAGTKYLNSMYFSSINEWGAEKNLNSIDRFYETKNAKALRDMSYLIIKVFRGKSPIYSDSSNAIILNQKCNRWNFIDIRYAKTVDEKWLSSIDKDYLIKQGDIIINSTGEGTLGRASIVDEQHEGLCVDSHMLVLRLDKTKVNPEFILRQINSEYGQKQIELLKSALATKQTELGIDNLLKIKFIMPIDSNGKIDLTTQNIIIDNHRSTLREMQTLLDRQRKLIEFAKENFENEIFN